MFGMGFFEIVVIVIVAIIFLGPDKLPQAIIDVVKFFKIARKTISDAKQTLDNELQLSALQQEASSYHQHFTNQVESITKDMQLKEIDELFSEYKSLPAPTPESSAQKSTSVDSSAESTPAPESKAPKAPKSQSPKVAQKPTKQTTTKPKQATTPRKPPAKNVAKNSVKSPATNPTKPAKSPAKPPKPTP